MKNSFKKTIYSLAIMTMITAVSLFSFIPNEARADNSVAGYITSLSPVILKMPGCTKAIGQGVTDLFGSIKSLFSKGGGGDNISDTVMKSLSPTTPSEAGFSGSGSETVPTTDTEVVSKLTETNTKLDAAKKSQDNIDKNQNCLNAIGKAIAKVLINQTTDSIIKWINTGDSGGPLFVQDQGAFFKNIAQDQILGFGAEIRDPKLYPFGADFMKAESDAFKAKFANNAQYSLDKMITDGNPYYSAQTFSQDFSQGGWDAWDAMTQLPANNPLGFALMASNELGRRIEENTQLAAGSLQMSGGYLGVQQCANPKGLSKQENEARKKRNAENSMGPPEQTCSQWVTVTPGKLIGDQLVSAIDKKDHALLDVQTLNDAMAAILDAVLSKFTSSLQSDTGLAGLTPGNPYEINTDVGTSGDSGFTDFKTQKDYPDAEINASTWLQHNSNFDIRTDLNQALIDEQRTYMDKLIEQDKELESTEVPSSIQFTKLDGSPTTLQTTGNVGLIPTINQLDYCIPGPHPGWESDARTALDAIESDQKIIPNTDGMDFMQIAQLTGQLNNNAGLEAYFILQALPFVGGSVTSTSSLDQWATILGSGNANCGAGVSVTGCVDRKLYEPIVRSFTNIGVNDNHDDSEQSYDKVVGLLDRVYDEYVKAIHNIYIPEVLPSVAGEAAAKFQEIPRYEKILRDNEATIVAMQSVITRLDGIKQAVDALNQQLANNSIVDANGNRVPKVPVPLADGSMSIGQQEQYEINIKPYLSAFGRLSSQMISPEDISAASSLSKQITDEKDYVYNDLLKGPEGCEQTLNSWAKMNNWADSPMPIQISPAMQNRPDYPFPILYNYPDEAKRETSQGNRLDKAFLYYGLYSSVHSWSTTDQKNAGELCLAYEKYGQDTSKCYFSNGQTFDKYNPSGPNIIHIGDLINIADDQTKIIKNYFESHLGIY